MCVSGATIGTALAVNSFVMGVAETINASENEKKNAKYRTQVAINNAQIAKNDALREKQKGINEARKEKIYGIQKSRELLARNSAGNFSISSDTTKNSYNDILNGSYSSAKEIQDEYDYRANDLFNRSNNYLREASHASRTKNNSALDIALSGLGATQKVSKNWYGFNKKGG